MIHTDKAWESRGKVHWWVYTLVCDMGSQSNAMEPRAKICEYKEGCTDMCACTHTRAPDACMHKHTGIHMHQGWEQKHFAISLLRLLFFSRLEQRKTHEEKEGQWGFDCFLFEVIHGEVDFNLNAGLVTLGVAAHMQGRTLSNLPVTM